MMYFPVVSGSGRTLCSRLASSRHSPAMIEYVLLRPSWVFLLMPSGGSDVVILPRRAIDFGLNPLTFFFSFSTSMISSVLPGLHRGYKIGCLGVSARV